MDHPIIITFLVIAVTGTLYFAAEVLKPLALAVLMAFVLEPVSRFLERRGLGRGPAVFLTVTLALGLFVGIGTVMTRELWSMAKRLPAYEGRILKKIESLKPKHATTQRFQKVIDDVARRLDEPIVPRPGPAHPVSDVRVVDQPRFRERLMETIGPLLEPLAIGAMVIILVLFLLLQREDLSDRLIRIVGEHRVSLTTRTLDEVGSRISRYLLMFASVNSMYGVLVWIGLWAIGVPYAGLWGVLAGLLRFIPYLGVTIAFALPLVFSVAAAPTGSWREPFGVIVLFGSLEVAANTYLEPVIYGKTTGVSAFGLLVAAMFWTWLWGGLGLLLSTPLTVCLAVLGKYVPSLQIFATLLGEEPALEADVRFYQRLLALDQDGASELIDTALKQMPRAEVFDRILIPALARAERDYAREEIDDCDQAFLWRVIGDIVADLEGESQIALGTVQAAEKAATAKLSPQIVGVPANDVADELVLRMLAQVIEPAGVDLEIVNDTASPLRLSEILTDHGPALIILSHVPPGGLTSARYLVKRLRARLGEVSILVGRWGAGGDMERIVEKLTGVGATHVAFSLAEARERIFEHLPSQAQAGQAVA
jgi:predicted PurR-regulated permease PerM